MCPVHAADQHLPHLWTAPAGSGKTQHVVEEISAQTESATLPNILVIVPSGRQLVALRERLALLRKPIFGVDLTDFHTLYRDILDAAGTFSHLMPEAARYRVMRAVIRQMREQDPQFYFAPIAEMPGFIESILGLIAELKEGEILPERIEKLDGGKRTQGLAALYRRYQELLQRNQLADREGMGWLARNALASDANLYAQFDYVAIDGFDEFNPTQLAILELLAARVSALDITLTYEPHRPNRLAHTRFKRTRQRFGHVNDTPIDKHAPPRPKPLEHLERNLFESTAQACDAEGTVTLITAPNRDREVRAIARRVKELLLAGAPAEQIVIVFRRLETYQSLMRQVLIEYGVPFRIRQGMPLRSNPLVAALTNLLSLSANEWPWRDTLDALRSPYFGFREITPDGLGRVEQITRQAVVVRSRDAWVKAFLKPEAPLREDEPDDRLVMQLGAEELGALQSALDACFGRLTPPAQATVREYVSFIEGLLGPDPAAEAWQKEHFPEQFHEDVTSLRVVERARQVTPPEGNPSDGVDVAARDLAALVELKNVLRGLVQAAEIQKEGPVAWSEFLADLMGAVDAAAYDLMPSVDGRVLVCSATQARGVPRDYVFLGGLVEGDFPARPGQDPLLTTHERDALGLAHTARDETTLFYETVTLARAGLFLSRPERDEDANPLFPSPYLASVEQVLTGISKITLPLNYHPEPDEAASLGELAVALTPGLGNRVPSALQLSEMLKHGSDAWNASLRARKVEYDRESAAAFDAYTGLITDPALCADLKTRFGPRHNWSASQLNLWGGCGFRFFARRVLGLEEIVEPVQGLDALQLGAIYHKILEQTYKQLMERGVAVMPATLEQAQEIMHAIAVPLLDRAAEHYAFRPTAWWRAEQAEIIHRLDLLFAAEAERNAKISSSPVQVEVPFGLEQTPPLILDLPAGTIRVRGKIDRIDRVGEGYVLIDYKSGSTPISSSEVILGTNLQLPIYVLAAEAMQYRVVDAFFLHIRNGAASGGLARVDRDGWLDAARHHINSYVSQARAGAFVVYPKKLDNGACKSSCEFECLCRVGRANLNKPLPTGLATL